MDNFTIDGTNYTTNEAGTYFYKEENGKKTRIKKAEYEQAWDEYMATANDRADVDEWQAEADAELEAREQAQAESDKQAENAVNNTENKKASKPRKSKDVAHKSNGITLTEKQVAFIKRMPEDDFYEHGLDSALWIDVYCDVIANQFNPMAVGAMVSTLREKDIITVSEDRINGKKCKYMAFTPLGKQVAKELGLN